MSGKKRSLAKEVDLRNRPCHAHTLDASYYGCAARALEKLRDTATRNLLLTQPHVFAYGSNRMSAERTSVQVAGSRAYTVNQIDIGDEIVAIDGAEVMMRSMWRRRRRRRRRGRG